MPIRGYRYIFGIHMGICRGPVDEITEIRVGDRTAWTGSVTSNQHVPIEAYDLFGGEDGEGGVQGELCVMMGNSDQVACPGLVAMINNGSLSSASINVYNFNVVSTATGVNAKAEFGLRANGTAYKIENGVTIELPGMWVTGAPIPDGGNFASFYEGYWESEQLPGDGGGLSLPDSDVADVGSFHSLANGVRIWVAPPSEAFPTPRILTGRYYIRAVSGIIIANIEITMNSGSFV